MEIIFWVLSKRSTLQLANGRRKSLCMNRGTSYLLSLERTIKYMRSAASEGGTINLLNLSKSSILKPKNGSSFLPWMNPGGLSQQLCSLTESMRSVASMDRCTWTLSKSTKKATSNGATLLLWASQDVLIQLFQFSSLRRSTCLEGSTIFHSILLNATTW